MIVPDVNILLYGLNAESPFYSRAKAWVEATFSSGETIGLPWVVILGVLRTSTSSRVFGQPLTSIQAFELIEGWLNLPSIVVIHPGPRHHAVLRELLEEAGTAGNLVIDAHLAALAVEYGGVVATADRDFGRFPGLRVVYPLSPA